MKRQSTLSPRKQSEKHEHVRESKRLKMMHCVPGSSSESELQPEHMVEQAVSNGNKLPEYASSSDPDSLETAIMHTDNHHHNGSNGLQGINQELSAFRPYLSQSHSSDEIAHLCNFSDEFLKEKLDSGLSSPNNSLSESPSSVGSNPGYESGFSKQYPIHHVSFSDSQMPTFVTGSSMPNLIDTHEFVEGIDAEMLSHPPELESENIMASVSAAPENSAEIFDLESHPATEVTSRIPETVADKSSPDNCLPSSSSGEATVSTNYSSRKNAIFVKDVADDDFLDEQPINGTADVSREENEVNVEEEDGAEQSLNVKDVSIDVKNVENMLHGHLKVTQLEGHADAIFAVDVDADYIISSGGDTTVKIWSVETATEIHNLAGHTDAVTSLVLLSKNQSLNLSRKLNLPEDSRIIMSGSLDCHVRLWNLLDGQNIGSVYTFNAITSLGYLEQEMLVVVGTDGGKLEFWDLTGAGMRYSYYAHAESVSSLQVTEANIFTTSCDGKVKAWGFLDGEWHVVYERNRQEMKNRNLQPAQWKAIAVHRDALYLGDNSGCLKMILWTEGRLKSYLNNEVNSTCEAISIKDDILLSSFRDSKTDTGGINVWKLPENASKDAAFTYVCSLTGDVQDISSLAMSFTENGVRIVSGGHQLLVWDFDFKKPPVADDQEGYVVQAVDRIGSEINESTAVKHIPTTVPITSTQEDTEKRSYCSIS